ncbi:MAG: dethiobiotin synthase [Planctomycetota bacterium]|nr:dethiobiotin synthase [Planctomycetota bacterium]
MRGLFITGTDTGVGKTWVTAMVARHLDQQGLRVGAYKPTASGSQDGRWADVDVLREAIGGRFPEERICPQRFDAPLAPPEAARLENREIDSGLLRSGALWWSDQVDTLLVEGVGGLLCPLTESETIADLAVDLGWPIVIVARNALGTINHTLLTIDVARRRGLKISGVVLNQPDPPDSHDCSLDTNAGAIGRFGNVEILGHVAYGGRDLLPPDGTATIDWLSVTDHCP